jgi:hypothetical protein
MLMTGTAGITSESGGGPDDGRSGGTATFTVAHTTLPTANDNDDCRELAQSKEGTVSPHALDVYAEERA